MTDLPVPIERPRPRWQRWSLITAGWIFLVLGILGLVLPILQGWLFLGIGLLLLSREQAWAHRLMLSLRRRFPRLAEKTDEAEAYVARLGRRIVGWFRR